MAYYPPPRRTGWLYRCPPFRLSFKSRHRRHIELGEAIFMSIGLMLALEIMAMIWTVEVIVWLGIWCCIGAGRAARWFYRENIGGKAVMAIQRRRHPYVDPNPRPIDLATLGQPPHAGPHTHVIGYAPGHDPWVDPDPWDTGRTRRRS